MFAQSDLDFLLASAAEWDEAMWGKANYSLSEATAGRPFLS